MSMIRLACNLAIHVSQAVLDTMDGRRPMMDDPLSDLDEFTDLAGQCGPRLMWGPELTTCVVGSDQFSGSENATSTVSQAW